MCLSKMFVVAVWLEAAKMTHQWKKLASQPRGLSRNHTGQTSARYAPVLYCHPAHSAHRFARLKEISHHSKKKLEGGQKKPSQISKPNRFKNIV